MNTYARENNNGDRGATEFLLFNLKPTDGFAKPARDMFYEPSQPFLIKDLLDDVTSAVCSYYSAEEDPSGGDRCVSLEIVNIRSVFTAQRWRL